MKAIDFSLLQIEQLITHHVGNKLRDESILLSHEPTKMDEHARGYLRDYLLSPFNLEDRYSFTHAVQLEMNEVYRIAQQIFENPEELLTHSQSIAKLLYETNMHPKIKEGKLNVVYCTHITIGSFVTDGIGIFKTENDTPYLQLTDEEEGFSLQSQVGFEIKGMEKGCLILNTQEKDGYEVLLATASSAESQYWRNDFLQVKSQSTEYHQTQQFLGLAKNYVTQQFANEFEAQKTDQIDLLNRSVQYFKSHENFDRTSFEEEVLYDPNIIESFRNFDSHYRQENDIQLDDSFAISAQAVKKQARVFKSVLKLDKNFHIYIHGNREMIEHGVDENGRKYYKIYYENES
ncbi:MAG: nucleoid-associated protein [Chitinophagales bacterium]|nr:nucleoid-associated protein [Chitinophagales bacterium]